MSICRYLICVAMVVNVSCKPQDGTCVGLTESEANIISAEICEKTVPNEATWAGAIMRQGDGDSPFLVGLHIEGELALIMEIFSQLANDCHNRYDVADAAHTRWWSTFGGHGIQWWEDARCEKGFVSGSLYVSLLVRDNSGVACLELLRDDFAADSRPVRILLAGSIFSPIRRDVSPGKGRPVYAKCSRRCPGLRESGSGHTKENVAPFATNVSAPSPPGLPKPPQPTDSP